MPIDINSLPKDPAILQQMLADLTAQLDKTHRLLRQLLEVRSGTKSEQLGPDQLKLFVQELGSANEAKADPQNDGGDPPPDAGSNSEEKEESRRRGRRPLPPHLKRKRIEHDLTEEGKHCAECQQDLRPIGEESSERYEYIPAQFLVIEDICKKYACQCTVKTAIKPPQPIEKSTAGASLLAHVIVSKIADHLPVHRQAKIVRRSGVKIADQTMCGWMWQSAEVLEPLYGCLKNFVFSSKVAGTDDTPVRVLDKTLKGTTRKGRFWPYVGDRNHQAVVFDYTATRERAGPEKFLKDYKGYLQADAYVVYDSFFTDPERGLVEVGCWTHTRRHFYNARDTDPVRMGAVLAHIAQLYVVEGKAREAGIVGDDLRILRQQASVPWLASCMSTWRRFATNFYPRAKPAKQWLTH